jgi:D-alanyl-D-alanine carboxypeptidase (penicillin-binding protein 5/6)
MAILARALIHDYPESYSLYSEKEFIYNKIKQQNRNLLLWRDHTVDGIKTGHTDDAGFCLVASSVRDNMRLQAAIMGAENENARATQAEALLNYGFRFFKTYQIYSGQSVINKLRVFKGRQDSVNLGVVEGLYVTVPQGQENNLTTRLLMEKYLVAPVQAQQPSGTVTVLLNDQPIHQQSLIALEAVEQGNIFRRCIDQIKLWVFRLFNRGHAA